ncbi:MAG TPA: NapC/NirT family cytochrome c [Bacillota bacterium]|jgi:hypothetical protein
MEWFRRHFRTIYEGITGLPPGLRAGLLAGGAVVLAVLLVVGFRAYRYTQNNPQFCRSCHLMETPFRLWQGSVHSTVNCHSCHESSIKTSLRQVFETVTRHPIQVTKHAVVPGAACQRCHSGPGGTPDITGTDIHVAHVERRKIQCTDCHGTSLHVFQAPEAICQKCHGPYEKGGAKAEKTLGMQDLPCGSCHQYLGQTGSLLPARPTCLGCHQPALTAGLHAAPMHSGTDCYVCHQVHLEALPSRAPCETCHSDKQNHFPGQVCRTCHGFRPGTAAGTAETD